MPNHALHPAFKKAIRELATRLLLKELEEFISTGDIPQPRMTATPGAITDFSVHTLSETMMRRATLCFRD